MTVLLCLGKLMSALLNSIHDRSSVVQKQYAFALGHLVRVNILPFLDSVCTEGYFHGVFCCVAPLPIRLQKTAA